MAGEKIRACWEVLDLVLAMVVVTLLATKAAIGAAGKAVISWASRAATVDVQQVVTMVVKKGVIRRVT